MNSVLNNDLEDPTMFIPIKQPKRNSVLTENVFAIYAAIKVFVVQNWHKLKFQLVQKFGTDRSTYSSEGGVGEYSS